MVNATLRVANYATFTNNGAGATWTAFDMPGTGYQTAVALTDPTTGLPRLIFGNDTGVWSVLDDNGTFETAIGGTQNGAPTPGINRNGNLQLAQFYYGAAQPSNAAAQIAGALFYGAAQDNGGPFSASNILSTGNLQWSVSPGNTSWVLDSSGVAVDQQGLGTVDQYWFPGTPRRWQLRLHQFLPGRRRRSDLRPVPGQRRPAHSRPAMGDREGVANIALDPVNDQDAIISSSTGRIFSTTNEGGTWFDIGDPAVFGSPTGYSVALSYGAPDPTAPEGIGNLGNFIYVGTQTGQIYVTQDGGGSGTSNNWINISTGLDGSAVTSIITDPVRGSHDAYAITTTGVFFLANSIPSPSSLTPTWVNITGNLKTLAYSIFGQSYNPATDTNAQTYDLATALTSIVADWRYIIPNNPSNPSQGTHPVLYVGANSGVYQSLDNGKTWALFPDPTYGAVTAGGDLPHVNVTDLGVSLGNVNSNTGMPNLAGPFQTLVFTGTLTTGSATVAGITTGLAVGDDITGTGIPSGTTIVAISGSSFTLSQNATASGSKTLAAANPATAADPDLLLAATFGQGEFAINLPPLILENHHEQLHHGHPDHFGDRKQHIAGRRRPGHDRRLERDHRLRQRHLDHRRRRDQSSRPSCHCRLQSRPTGSDSQLEQLHKRPGKFHHPVRPGQLLHVQRYENDRGLRHR